MSVDKMHRARWTEAEIEYLVRTYPTDRPINDIAADLGRSFFAVIARARILDLYRPLPGGPKISREQQRFIAENYAKMGSAALANRFGVSRQWINRIAIRYGARAKMEGRHPQDRVRQVVRSTVRQSYGKVAAAHGMTIGQVAGILHRARRGVYGAELRP